MATPLPPFGIRNLRQSQEPYTVLQVNESQYKSAIETDPAAALTYIDEDDGENVVVGSSLELKQRLEEPTSGTAPRVQYFNAESSILKNQYIHLFDIQNTGSAQSIWSQNHAVYTHLQDLLANQGRTSRRSSVAESVAPLLDRVEIKDETSRVEDKPQSQQQAQISPQLSVVLSEAVPDLVDNLASLLQATSETLRKAAEKTRETNRSPVEDILSGVSGIVTEIGHFGLSLLETLESKREEDASAGETQEPSQPSDKSSTLSRLSFVDARENKSVSTLSVGNDLTPQVTPPLDMPSSDVEPAHLEEDGCHFCKSFKLQCRKSPNSTMACTNCVTLARPCTNMPILVNPFLDPSEEENDSEELGVEALRYSSILDQDTDDADFSRRYPPLLSLRRANTVAGLRERVTAPSDPDPDFHSLSRHNSWALRFPHRPVPQVLDAETQRRKDFARRCFPGQEYSPGVGTDNSKIPRPHPSKLSRSSKSLGHATSHKRTRTVQTAAPAPVKVEDSADRVSADARATETPKSRVDVEESRPERHVPGAAIQHHQPPSAFPLAESSTSFWSRMTPHEPVQDRQLDPKERLTRHQSLTSQLPVRNPFHALNRSRTVNDGSNAPFRLNRPFDPLNSEVPAPAISSTTSPMDSYYAALTDPRTCVKADTERDVTEATHVGNSQRPASLRRPFSPVWEDHSDLNEKQDKTDRNNSLDQKGESSSLYSPPARHMRSVPNFSTLRTIAPSFNGSSNRPLSVHSAAQAVAAAAKSARQSAVSPPSPPPPSWPHPPAVFMSQEMPLRSASQTRLPSVPPPPPPPKPSQRSRDDHGILVPSDRFVKACLDKLLLMGYGSDDANLKSRLHIYAEAAKGDVMDAVEMIEEDKQANAETQPRGAQRYDRRMDWESS